MSITATEEQLAAAFAEWERRFQAQPESDRTPKGTPEEYGKACAALLIKLLAEKR